MSPEWISLDSYQTIQGIALKMVEQARRSVKIICADLEPIIKNGHRFLELSRRLSSRIKLRRLSDEHSEYDQPIIIVDTRSVVPRPSAGHYEGEYSLNAPREARELNHTFQEMWEMAELVREFYRIHI